MRQRAEKLSETLPDGALTRRSVLSGGAAALAALVGLGSSSTALASGRIPYGVAVALEPFRNDPQLRERLIRDVDLIVPMNALKWASLRHTEGQFDFGGADELVIFARNHGKTLHGHALLWYAYNPTWIDAVTSPSRLETLLRTHIETVVSRYAGQIATWDVVNEVIAHDPLNQGKWRRGVWYDVLGPRHVEIAFQAAAQADPTAKLFINDYDLEDDSLRTSARQKAMLSIVRRLQDRNIPIHGVGLQAHLYAERAIGVEGLQAFVGELTALGLEVAVTELDVIDWKLSADTAVRDRAVARTAQEFLSALTGAATPRNITTWGMNDRYSWIDETFPRKDSAKARPLPFDSQWRPKPLWDVIKRY
ncbi:MAG: endo-1,4-beta-xylanase, partial [Pseudomonadota bacterium]